MRQILRLNAIKDGVTKHKHTGTVKFHRRFTRTLTLDSLMGRRSLYDDEDKACRRKWALEDYRKKHRDFINQKARERSAKQRSNIKCLSVEEQEVQRLKQLAYAKKYRERLMSACIRNRERLRAKARARRV
ncbi:hypothetical protein DXG01_016609, partial [Tephrocybe rancida]